jgi:putative heme-binding domain-containing protein
MDLERFVRLAEQTPMGLPARHIGRRVASLSKNGPGLELIAASLLKTQGSARTELLAGTIEGLAGRRSVPLPKTWPATYAQLQREDDAALREQALQLALVFDDPTALATLRRTAGDKAAAAAVRNRALDRLLAKHDAALPPLLLQWVDDDAVRRSAIRGLAEYNHADTPQVLLDRYARWDAATRQDVVQTLSARVAWGTKLLDAVAAENVSRGDITAYTARQLTSLGDPQLTARVTQVWGEVRSSSAEKTQTIAAIKKRLTPTALAQGNRSAGRAVFQKACANCHRFFDAGGNIGPDITGSQRTNLDYLLQTLVDPSAAVPKDYQMQVFATTSGRVVTGLVVEETKAAVTVQTVNEKIVVPTNEIEKRMTSPLSMMPEGMLQNMPAEDVRNLLAYLMGPGQAPLAEEKPKAE